MSKCVMLCDAATACWRKLTPDYFLVGGVSLQGGIAEHHARVFPSFGAVLRRGEAQTVRALSRVGGNHQNAEAGRVGCELVAATGSTRTYNEEAARMFLGRGARAASGGHCR